MGLKVLIVDDSKVMRLMIQKTISMTGLEIDEARHAANGQEGLTQLGEWAADLVVVDINMPVMNGEEMIRAMRTEPKLTHIPIIVISTEGSETRIERLKTMGARFIHKPFSPEQFRDTIQDLLA